MEDEIVFSQISHKSECEDLLNTNVVEKIQPVDLSSTYGKATMSEVATDGETTSLQNADVLAHQHLLKQQLQQVLLVKAQIASALQRRAAAAAAAAGSTALPLLHQMIQAPAAELSNLQTSNDFERPPLEEHIPAAQSASQIDCSLFGLVHQEKLQIIPPADDSDNTYATADAASEFDQDEQKCPCCDYSSNINDHFKLHILSHLLVPSANASAYSVKQSSEPIGVSQSDKNKCIQQSLNDSASPNHTSQTSTAKFACQVCSFLTSNEHVFSIHVMTHCSKTEPLSEDSFVPCPEPEGDASTLTQTFRVKKKLYCPICRFCSVYKSNFDRHLARHIRSGRICCDKCTYATESIQDIKVHVASHYARISQRISCPHCDFTTANKSYFKVHLATHTGEGKMYCSYCSYSTVYKSNFKQHVSAHENKTELQCPMCDFKCVCKSEYGLHFATHTGEKRLACPFCKFNTSNKSYFKQHVGSHTGAGKLACPFCKFSTVNKSYYRIHVSKHTGEGTLRCRLCSFTTVYKNNFRRHIAKHQTVEEESLKQMAAVSQVPLQEEEPQLFDKQYDVSLMCSNNLFTKHNNFLKLDKESLLCKSGSVHVESLQQPEVKISYNEIKADECNTLMSEELPDPEPETMMSQSEELICQVDLDSTSIPSQCKVVPVSENGISVNNATTSELDSTSISQRCFPILTQLSDSSMNSSGCSLPKTSAFWSQTLLS